MMTCDIFAEKRYWTIFHVINYASIQTEYLSPSKVLRFAKTMSRDLISGWSFIEMYSFLFRYFYHQASLFIYLRNLFF